MNWSAILTNPIGTVTAICGAVLGALTLLGCDPGSIDFGATCKLPTWVPSQWALAITPIAVTITGITALVLKSVRPGGFLHSWFGSTAVLATSGKVGTAALVVEPTEAKAGVVTSKQVATTGPEK